MVHSAAACHEPRRLCAIGSCSGPSPVNPSLQPAPRRQPGLLSSALSGSSSSRALTAAGNRLPRFTIGGAAALGLALVPELLAFCQCHLHFHFAVLEVQA